MKKGTLLYVLHDVSNLLLDLPMQLQCIDVPGQGVYLCLVPANVSMINKIFAESFNEIIKERLAERLRNWPAGSTIRVEWNEFSHRPKDELLYLIWLINDIIKSLGFVVDPQIKSDMNYSAYEPQTEV